MRRNVLLGTLLGAFLAGAATLGAVPLAAQPPAADPAPAVNPATPPTALEAPFDTAAAIRSYLERLSPEEKARSDAYAEGGYWLALWGFLWTVAVAGLLLATRLSAGLRDWARKGTGRPWLVTLLYAIPYTVVSAVLFFPLTVYRDYFREHRYGLATQDFGAWLGDQAKGLAVTAVLLAIFLPVLYTAFRRAPRTWWLWGSAASAAFFVFVLLVAPVYIAPLFNTYTPLEDPEIAEPILLLARANGVPADDVYEVDASRQTTRISANVSGFLGTLRISLNDNLLARGTQPEIEAVMAHEMGHYALHHSWIGIVFMGLLALGGFAFVRWGFDRTLARFGRRWRVEGLADPAGFPLLVLLFSTYLFVLTPVINTFVRTIESEADLYALNASRQPDGFASVAMKLAEYRKIEPGPWEERIFYDHPSGRSRVTMAMRWKAAQLELAELERRRRETGWLPTGE